MALTHVPVAPLPPERFRELLGDRYGEIEAAIARGQELFAGRAVWHVNSTARGGGVAELLQSLLAYARGAGVDTRWVVVGGNPDFFQVTKRIHNNLHGAPGDGGPLGEAEHAVYEETLRENAAELADTVAPDDIVFLHDPQTAGLVGPVLQTGATVVWRCHVGLDLPNDLARQAWDFLRGYVEGADAYVFSRREFVWEGLDTDKVWVVAPSIDAFSPKNQGLGPDAVAAILGVAGLRLDGDPTEARFLREDGTPARVDRAAEMFQDELIPARCAADHAGLPVGPSERSDGRGAVLRGEPRQRRGPSAARRPLCRGRDRRPGGRRGAGGGRPVPARAGSGDPRGECTSRRCRWKTCRRTRRW